MVCSKCGHIMGMGMKYCSKCGAVVGQAENEVSMEAVRSAFAPANSEPVETTPARPVGFQSLDGAPVYHVPMKNAQNNTAQQAAPAEQNSFINRPLPPTPVDITKSTSSDTRFIPEEPKKKSVLPIALPIAGVAVLAVGLGIIFGAKDSKAADSNGSERTQTEKNSGRNSVPYEHFTDPDYVAEDPTIIVTPAIQKKVTIAVSDLFGPVADASIELLNEKGEAVRSVVSKNDGYAPMTNIEPGTYTLHISKKGYADLNESITLDENTMMYDLLVDRSLEHLYTTLTLRTKSFTNDEEMGGTDVQIFAVNSENPNDAYITTKTDEYGICTLQNFPCGDFIIKCSSADHSTVVKAIDVSQDNGFFTAYLMPTPAEGEAYVVLDWNDEDLDLDLCAYNAELKEYVNVTHKSNANGSFIYDDHTGKAGVEAILLKDADSAAAQTFYVLDTTTAQSGSRSSAMGANGVNVTIYKYGQEAEVYPMEDNTDALIWTVGTLQSGSFTKLNVNEYSNIITDFYWASDILGVKKPDPTPVDEEADE